MAKLNRFTMPVFAGNAAQSQTSVFGSMKTSPQYTSDVAASVNTAAYGNGWADAVEVGYAPYMEDMNTLQKAITYQIAYSQQQGIPEWASDTEYYKGSLVKLNTASGSQIYSSLTDNNVGNLVSDTTKWKLMFDTANSYVTTNTTQTVSGAKTFSESPIIPTASSGDNSTKAASTAFVADAISGKQATITGAATTITSSNLTANRALIANGSGKVAVSAVTSTELGYLDGVTSAIQTQINAKAADNAVVHLTGNETIAGTKTFSSTIAGSINGNAATVTNGVYTTGNQTIGGTKTFSSTISGSINGNAATVTNGVYTTGNQTIGGTKTFSSSPLVPTASSSDNSTKAASTAFVKAQNYLTTVAKDLSYDMGGYIELSNDLIMQWGYTHRTGNDTSVTFGTPFGKQPCVIISPNYGDNAYAPSPRLVTTTSFDIMCKTGVDGYLWFAIGPKVS